MFNSKNVHQNYTEIPLYYYVHIILHLFTIAAKKYEIISVLFLVISD